MFGAYIYPFIKCLVGNSKSNKTKKSTRTSKVLLTSYQSWSLPNQWEGESNVSCVQQLRSYHLSGAILSTCLESLLIWLFLFLSSPAKYQNNKWPKREIRGDGNSIFVLSDPKKMKMSSLMRRSSSGVLPLMCRWWSSAALLILHWWLQLTFIPDCNYHTKDWLLIKSSCWSLANDSPPSHFSSIQTTRVERKVKERTRGVSLPLLYLHPTPPLHVI